MFWKENWNFLPPITEEDRIEAEIEAEAEELWVKEKFTEDSH